MIAQPDQFTVLPVCHALALLGRRNEGDVAKRYRARLRDDEIVPWSPSRRRTGHVQGNDMNTVRLMMEVNIRIS
jgi:hypothetical protein